MIVKLKKYFKKIGVFLLLFAMIFGFGRVQATESTRILIRKLRMARLEYSSDSYASKKMRSLIYVLEEADACNWDSTLDWVLELKFRMVCDDDYFDSQVAKLCSPGEYDIEALKMEPPIVADFGVSKLGRHWKLMRHGDGLSLECV